MPNIHHFMFQIKPYILLYKIKPSEVMAGKTDTTGFHGHSYFERKKLLPDVQIRYETRRSIDYNSVLCLYTYLNLNLNVVIKKSIDKFVSPYLSFELRSVHTCVKFTSVPLLNNDIFEISIISFC